MIYRQRTDAIVLDLWEFFSKWGFGGGDDGAALEAAWQIREHVVEVLNKYLPPDIRAEVWDGCSIHNECLISLTQGEKRDISPADGIWSDEELFLEQTWPVPELAGVMKQVVAELRAEYVESQMVCLPVHKVREVCQAALYALDPERALLERGWWGKDDQPEAIALLDRFLDCLPEGESPDALPD